VHGEQASLFNAAFSVPFFASLNFFGRTCDDLFSNIASFVHYFTFRDDPNGICSKLSILRGVLTVPANAFLASRFGLLVFQLKIASQLVKRTPESGREQPSFPKHSGGGKSAFYLNYRLLASRKLHAVFISVVTFISVSVSLGVAYSDEGSVESFANSSCSEYFGKSHFLDKSV